jgi:3-oxoacyl-[acyl-carrier-protein] synthase II
VTASVITAWDAYSPLGSGAQAHLAGLRNAPTPEPRTRLHGFEIREVLGRSGTRAMDRAAGLAVATTRRLLERVGAPEAPFGAYPPEAVGLVLGVSDSVKSVSDFVHDTWTRDKPFDIDPSHIPRTLMNYAAGQCAIWHGVKGPNATICGSHATGLLALNYARRLQQNGHAMATIWGAVEEYSDARAAIESARSDGVDRLPPGEGCVMFLLESAESVCASRPPLAEVLAVEFGVWADPGEIQQMLVRCIRRALKRSLADPGDVFAIAPSSARGSYADKERAAAAEVFADVPSLTVTVDAVGDTRAASAVFQIVELLAQPGIPGRIGVATTVDMEGRVGCALLRLC